MISFFLFLNRDCQEEQIKINHVFAVATSIQILLSRGDSTTLEKMEKDSFSNVSLSKSYFGRSVFVRVRTIESVIDTLDNTATHPAVVEIQRQLHKNEDLLKRQYIKS